MFKGEMDIYISTDKFERNLRHHQYSQYQPASDHCRNGQGICLHLSIKKTAMERLEIWETVTAHRWNIRFVMLSIVRSLGGGRLDYNVSTSLDKIFISGNQLHFHRRGWSGRRGRTREPGWCYGAGCFLQRHSIGATSYVGINTSAQSRQVKLATAATLFPGSSELHCQTSRSKPRIMFDNYMVDVSPIPSLRSNCTSMTAWLVFRKPTRRATTDFSSLTLRNRADFTVKTFSKYGDINVNEKQIQIPFSFVPKGILSYNIQPGKVDGNSTLTKDAYFGNANLLYGCNQLADAQ